MDHESNNLNYNDDENYDAEHEAHSQQSMDSDELDLNSSTSSEERWSLSVRINSAVDLPSSIIPTMPLCPSLKFGLITVTEDDEILDLEKSSAKFRRAVFEQEQVNVKDLNVNAMDLEGGGSASGGASPATGDNDDNNDGDTASYIERYQRQNSLKMYCFSGKKGTLAKFQNNVPLEDCIASAISSSQDESNGHKLHPSPAKVQLTSGKIMSKRDNGMVEWNEDIRWDDVELPLQTVLCIELSAKAVFPPSFIDQVSNYQDGNDSASTSSYSTMAESWNVLKRNYSHGALDSMSGNSTPANAANGGNSAPSSGNGGLLGFWRKRGSRGGRGNNINLSTNSMAGAGSTLLSNTSSYHGSDDAEFNDEMEKAAAAAAVARYIMDQEGDSNDDYTEGDGGNDDNQDDDGSDQNNDNANDHSDKKKYR